MSSVLSVPGAASAAPSRADGSTPARRLRVVPRRRVRAARLPFVTLVTMILLGGVVGLVCFNTSLQQPALTATGLDQQAAQLSDEQQSLLTQLQRLRSPQRLARAAQQQGMVIPTGVCVLSLATGQPCADPIPADRSNTPPLRRTR